MILKFCLCLLAGIVVAVGAPAAATIQKGNIIMITITGVPETEMTAISGPYPISDKGMVSMPYVGMIPAAGLSAQELKTALKIKFAENEIFQNADFQIGIIIGCSPLEPGITVGGRVKQPGPFAFRQGMPLWQAIQAAGGADYFANMTRVKLFRAGKMQTYNMEDEKSREIQLNINDAIKVSGIQYNDSPAAGSD